MVLLPFLVKGFFSPVKSGLADSFTVEKQKQKQKQKCQTSLKV
jgi:hypothetical protein